MILGLVAGLLLAPGRVWAAPATGVGALDRYELRVKLDPPRQTLDVSGTLTVRVPRPGTQELTWLLNRQLEVKTLTGPLVASWTFDRVPGREPGTLKVRFRRPVGPDDPVQFRVRYLGALTQWPEHGPNVLTPAWTELGRSVFWFPVRPEAPPFTFRLEVQCQPGYGLVSYGPLKPGPGLRTLEWNQPVTDLLLVAAPANQLHVWNPAPKVRLVVTDLAMASAARLAQDMGRLMLSFRERLGPAEAGALTLVQSRRQEGGSSAAPGFLVAAGLTEARLAEGLEELLQQLALSTARTWWNKAARASWEDWLNVSLSEYSALVALRDTVGETPYQRRIEAKRRASVGLPPLWQFDHSAPEAKPLMEAKGVILLAELEVFVGRDRFGAFCRTLAGRKTLTTAAFLDLLETHAGKAEREAFQRRIMTL